MFNSEDIVMSVVSMYEIQISRPTIEDLPDLDTFFELILTDTFEKNGYLNLDELRDSEILLKKEFVRNDLFEDDEKPYFLMAKNIDGTIIGTIACGPANEDILTCTANAYKGIPEIGSLFVHPDYQGKGLASQLIDAIEVYLSSNGYTQYCLDSGYRLAQKTWTQKFGEPAYLIKDHWGEGADHMIWLVEIY